MRYVSLDKRGFWDFAGFFWRTARLMRRLDPDVLHGYMDVGNMVAVTLKPLLRRSRIVWGVRTSNFDQRAYDVAGQLLSRILILASRWTDLIICNSIAGAAQVVTHGYPADKVVVVVNGVDTDRFRPMPEAGARLRLQWGIASGNPSSASWLGPTP